MTVIHDSKANPIFEFPEVDSKRVMPTKVQESVLPSGAASEAKQDDIITELERKADLTETQPISVEELPLPSGAATSVRQQPPVTTPTAHNVNLTNANIEYAFDVPANTREIRFRCRTLFDVRFAWEEGKAGGSNSPYLTLPAGSDYWSDNNNLEDQTLYFSSSTAGVVVEIERWSA